MLRFDRTVSSEVPAAPSRCIEVLADIESYPDWSSLVGGIEVLERGADGQPQKILMRTELLGLSLTMTCLLELGDDRAALRRLPHDGAGDEERFDAAWTVRPSGAGSTVALHVAAALDAPSAIGLLGGRVAKKLVDDLLGDFRRAI
ncbi:MAG: cyclase [Conexibacter sp.]|nr:cyclase [Conexibacter sp.]